MNYNSLAKAIGFVLIPIATVAVGYWLCSIFGISAFLAIMGFILFFIFTSIAYGAIEDDRERKERNAKND